MLFLPLFVASAYHAETSILGRLNDHNRFLGNRENSFSNWATHHADNCSLSCDTYCFKSVDCLLCFTDDNI